MANDDRQSRRPAPEPAADAGGAATSPQKAAPSPDGREEAEVKELIRQIQAGQTHLYGDLVDRYRAQVAGIAYKMVGDYDDAKDISQTVFLKTFYNIERFDTSKRFSTWLYRIAVNASIDYIRKFRKHRFEELDDTADTQAGHPVTPERIYQLKEVREYILQATEKLNEKQRAAFVLKDLEGLDIEEIAQIMDMPQATVRWYLHRARKKLRHDLRRRFGSVLGRLGISEKS